MHRFHPFTTEHYATLAVGAVIALVLLLMGRAGGTMRRISTAVLVFGNLAAYPLSQWAWQNSGLDTSLDNLLPFHLCDVAAIVAGFALWTKRRTLMMLTYYWGLAATMQALITPAIEVGFPAWPFIVFFIQHFAIVIAALHMPLVEGWRPEKPFVKTPFRGYLYTLAYLLSVLAINFTLGSNFGFANHPPANPSLIDHLGPWPWYLLSFNVLCFVIFCALTLPFVRSMGKTNS